MTLWLRVRRAYQCVITIIIVAIALIPARSFYLPLPNLLGGPRLAVPLTFLLPVAVAIVVAWGLAAGDPLIEAIASRPLKLFDVGYAFSAALLALAACVLVWLTSGTDLALAAGRNVLGYIGLVLVGRRLIGAHAAALLPAGFAIAVSLFGTGIGRQTRLWAWPLAGAYDPIGWSSAIILLILGMIVALLYPDTITSEH